MLRLRTCKAIAGRCRGFWDFLVTREDRRRVVELEHARNAGTRALVEALGEDGGHVIEVEPNGRSRMIWMPERIQPSITQRVTGQRAVDSQIERGELTS